MTSTKCPSVKAFNRSSTTWAKKTLFILVPSSGLSSSHFLAMSRLDPSLLISIVLFSSLLVSHACLISSGVSFMSHLFYFCVSFSILSHFFSFLIPVSSLLLASSASIHASSCLFSSHLIFLYLPASSCLSFHLFLSHLVSHACLMSSSVS